MIVNGYAEMKPFLPAVEMKGTPNIFDDALEVAQDKLVSEILGTDLEEQIESREPEDKKLLKLCQRVISQQAFLSSIPDMDLVLTDAGFGVINNEQMAMASKDRVNALSANLRAKLDESKDALVTYLMKAYPQWRDTEEFARLSDGLMLTYADFKDKAVLNNVTAKVYPHSWSEFLDLNSALNVALMTDVASYISKDYASEIIEKIRDMEIFLPMEQKAIKHSEVAIAAIALGDHKTGHEQTMAAISVMKSDPESFPTYTASPEAQDLTLMHEDTPIFSML